MVGIVDPDGDRAGYSVRITEGTGPVNSKLVRPDHTDPATVGCLLTLASEAFPESVVYVKPIRARKGSPWVACYMHGGEFRQIRGATAGEALIKLLEAA